MESSVILTPTASAFLFLEASLCSTPLSATLFSSTPFSFPRAGFFFDGDPRATPRPNTSGPIVSGAASPETRLALRIVSSPAVACISRRLFTTPMVVSGSNTPRINATSASLDVPAS